MDTDPGILCFQHCGSKVFCFKLPELCPVCSADLQTAHFQILPFSDYLNSMDLHIGVTTSMGDVVEFDKNGLQKHRTKSWKQCLVVDTVSGPWMEYWDHILHNVADTIFWSSHRYDEDKFNCYTFVLTFLRKLQYGELSVAAKNRTTFCENFIVPRTVAAGKYISLYRKLLSTECYIHKENRNPSVALPI